MCNLSELAASVEFFETETTSDIDEDSGDDDFGDAEEVALYYGRYHEDDYSCDNEDEYEYDHDYDYDNECEYEYD